MHGLINRSIQRYVYDRHGEAVWRRVTRRAGVEADGFEAMLSYEDAVTPRLLNCVAEVLGRSRCEIMEDIGSFLVSASACEAVRRLLRFGGVTFAEFLQSLDDLPDRARLAVPDLHLPALSLHDESDGIYRLVCAADIAGYGHLLMGVLRGMADDYGALVLLEHSGSGDGTETVFIRLVEADFAKGREFLLGLRAG